MMGCVKMKYIMFTSNLRLNPDDQHDVIVPTAIAYSEENLKYAAKNAVDGIYEIKELVGNEIKPGKLDVIEAQAVYTAMMTDTLLEG